jgi:hypothetical protein
MPKFIVCPRCEGSGSHDPKAFSNGFSQDDFDADPEFAESYFRGDHDVTCERCGGLRVVDTDAEVLASIKAAMEYTCDECGAVAVSSLSCGYQEYPGAHTWTETNYFCAGHVGADWLKDNAAHLKACGAI